MAIAGLYLDPWVILSPKISKFLWENSQSPAPTWSDLIKKCQPPDRICSLTSPSIYKNPHCHRWSVPGSVGHPVPQNFEISMGEFTKSCTNLVRSHQEEPATG